MLLACSKEVGTNVRVRKKDIKLLFAYYDSCGAILVRSGSLAMKLDICQNINTRLPVFCGISIGMLDCVRIISLINTISVQHTLKLYSYTDESNNYNLFSTKFYLQYCVVINHLNVLNNIHVRLDFFLNFYNLFYLFHSSP